MNGKPAEHVSYTSISPIRLKLCQTRYAWMWKLTTYFDIWIQFFAIPRGPVTKSDWIFPRGQPLMKFSGPYKREKIAVKPSCSNLARIEKLIAHFSYTIVAFHTKLLNFNSSFLHHTIEWRRTWNSATSQVENFCQLLMLECIFHKKFFHFPSTFGRFTPFHRYIFDLVNLVRSWSAIQLTSLTQYQWGAKMENAVNKMNFPKKCIFRKTLGGGLYPSEYPWDGIYLNERVFWAYYG